MKSTFCKPRGGRPPAISPLSLLQASEMPSTLESNVGGAISAGNRTLKSKKGEFEFLKHPCMHEDRATHSHCQENSGLERSVRKELILA